MINSVKINFFIYIVLLEICCYLSFFFSYFFLNRVVTRVYCYWTEIPTRKNVNFFFCLFFCIVCYIQTTEVVKVGLWCANQTSTQKFFVFIFLSDCCFWFAFFSSIKYMFLLHHQYKINSKKKKSSILCYPLFIFNKGLVECFGAALSTNLYLK